MRPPLFRNVTQHFRSFRSSNRSPSSRVKQSSIAFPETSITNYQQTHRSISEERWFHDHETLEWPASFQQQASTWCTKLTECMQQSPPWKLVTCLSTQKIYRFLKNLKFHYCVQNSQLGPVLNQKNSICAVTIYSINIFRPHMRTSSKQPLSLKFPNYKFACYMPLPPHSPALVINNNFRRWV